MKFRNLQERLNQARARANEAYFASGKDASSREYELAMMEVRKLCEQIYAIRSNDKLRSKGGK